MSVTERYFQSLSLLVAAGTLFAFAILIMAHVAGPLAFVGTRTHCTQELPRSQPDVAFLLANGEALIPASHKFTLDIDWINWNPAYVRPGYVIASFKCSRHFAIVDYPYQPYYDDWNALGWMGG